MKQSKDWMYAQARHDALVILCNLQVQLMNAGRIAEADILGRAYWHVSEAH